MSSADPNPDPVIPGAVATAAMSDADRLALAAKLDDDLEQFIDGLERKRYTEGWPEDRWEEEMDKHPFFMKKPPEIGDELHPMLEGLQQLKYDPMENTTEQLAGTYKDDGNFYLKHKKVRMAVFSYTEGIRLKCQNPEVNATLYNNRSAAQFFLANYRSSIEDAAKAVALKPGYVKPLMRSAQANWHLNKLPECVRFCELVLAVEPKHAAALELRREAQAKRAQLDRDDRKQRTAERRSEQELQRVLSAIEARRIRFEQHPVGSSVLKVTAEMLKPSLEPLEDYPAHLEEDGSLVWPTAFCYPEFLFSDFHQTVSENVLMNDVLHELLAEPLQMDKRLVYTPTNVNIYFENRLAATCHKVNTFNRVADIVADKNFLVSNGSLTFYVVPKDSEVELEFVNKPRHPLRQW